ncbi:aldo/keto reductase [Streptomyces sp. NPDC005262]|uniref:aldo/keto reductase n=1 Tax=Streptomyces sp. NPDC005262 TaxID=3364710 RepID=UPI003678E55C
MIATLVILRFQLPHAALAVFYGVDRSTVTRAVHEIRTLLAVRGFAAPGEMGLRLHTLADVFAYATAKGVELRLDGTEVRVRRPKAGHPGRRSFVSGKMRQNTKKATVVTDGQGRTVWSVAIRPGRMHDQTAVKTEGIEALFEQYPHLRSCSVGTCSRVAPPSRSPPTPPASPGLRRLRRRAFPGRGRRCRRSRHRRTPRPRPRRVGPAQPGHRHRRSEISHTTPHCEPCSRRRCGERHTAPAALREHSVNAKPGKEIMMPNTHECELATGVKVPLVGFGTYLIPNEKTASAVESALAAGYRHIDTAEVYENERGVGEGLRRGMRRVGLERGDVFVTTKLWPLVRERNKTGEETLRSIEESLDRLGLEQVDLYLIHATFGREQRLEQWQGMVDAYKSGKALAIGVSNFNAAHIGELIEAGLPAPHANQIELHPWSQKPELVAYLNQKGITPIAYSSLAPLSTWRTAPGHASGKTQEMRAEGERSDSPFKKLAEKYAVTEAQLLLGWGVQSGYPVLPKSIDPVRMRENLDIFSFRIDDADMDYIRGMDRGAGLAWGEVDPTTSD